jgi:DNA relaxase NicK
MLEHNIDYIQMTCNMDEKDFTKQEVKSIRGLPYYPIGYEANNGIRYYFGSNKGMNCFVVLSGEQCQYLRDCGNTDKDTLEWVFANGGKVSRLDLAVTEFIEEDLFTMGDVKSWYEQDVIISSLAATGCKEISTVIRGGGNQVETLYIGNMSQRGRKGIFRAYDKSIEMGIGSEIISRIELELKREKAQLAASRIVQTGDIAGNFRTYFDVKSADFERIMQAPKQEAVRGKAKPKSNHEVANDDRCKWLLEAVAPALKEAILNDNELGLSNARAMDFMNRSGLTGLDPSWIKARKAKRTPKKRYNTLDFD